jgi:multiple antibiotic resistance protein
VKYSGFTLGAFLSLLSSVNPLLAIPVFVTLTSHFSPQERSRLARKTATNVFMILIGFFLTGGLLLKFLNLSIHAMRIGGGLMILQSALNRVNKKERLTPDEQEEASERDEIAFSPLAIPVLSGPGAIALIIGMTTDTDTFGQWAILPLVIFLVALVCYITLLAIDFLIKKLGRTVMRSVGRIMGFLLLCVGVQFIVNGIQGIVMDLAHKF